MGKKIDILDFFDSKKIPRDKPLSKEHEEFLKKKFPRKTGRIRYGIWKNEQRNGKQLVLFEEFPINQGRRPGVDNSVEFIAERKLSDSEYEEHIQNFGCNSRTYTMWRYENVDQMIIDDKSNCGAESPQVFINACRDRGYTETPHLFTELERNGKEAS
jgi:hypothetical protein